MRQNIVGDDHVGSPSFRPQLPREILIEEGTESRNAFLPGNLSRPFGRIDPEHGNTTPREVLEHVSIVAGELHHQAAGVQPPRSHQLFRVLPRVLQKRVRKGGIIRILPAEKDLRGDVLRELHQAAVRAAHNLQRKPELGKRQLTRLDQRIRQGRVAQR